MTRKLLLGLALAPALLLAQVVHLNSSDPIKGSQITINGNFDYLNAQIGSRPAYSGARTSGAVTVYDSDGNLISSNCRVSAGQLNCGDGTGSAGLSLPELEANGSHQFSMYGKDAQAASVCLIMPDARPTTGQALISSGGTATTTDGATCDVMAWGASGGGGGDRVAAPVTATDTCTLGTWAANPLYYFYCKGANAWVRAALADWTNTALPAFSPASGYSGATTDVTVTDATGGATIKYCTDADNTCDPASGTTYTAPVSMAATGYLRAVATSAGADASPIASWLGTIINMVSDAFSVDGALGAGWQDPLWVGGNGYNKVACLVSGGFVGVNATDDWRVCTAVRTDAALGNDGFVQGDFRFYNGGYGGLIWRATTDGGGSFYTLALEQDHFILYKLSGGNRAYSDEHATTTPTMTQGSWYTMRIEYQANFYTLKLAVQGQPLVNLGTWATDGTLTTGKPGIYLEDGGEPSSASMKFDNFLAQ